MARVYGGRSDCSIDTSMQPRLPPGQNNSEPSQQPTLSSSHSSSRGAAEPTLGQTGIEALDLMGEFLHASRFAAWQPLVGMSYMRTVHAAKLPVRHGMKLSTLPAADGTKEQPHRASDWRLDLPNPHHGRLFANLHRYGSGGKQVTTAGGPGDVTYVDRA